MSKTVKAARTTRRAAGDAQAAERGPSALGKRLGRRQARHGLRRVLSKLGL
jgi:hypothetical protein